MQGSTVRSAVVCLILGLVGLLRPDCAIAQEAVYDPAAVKAAFIYHFSTFVKWPEPAVAGQPFSITVLGDDDVALQLEQYLPGRRIMGRPMQVLRVDSAEDLDHTEVLFIGREAEEDVEEVAEAVRNRPVLVVSDAPRGLDKGAMINFLIVERHVRFEISLPAAERAGLGLSSRLLAAAQQVRTSDILMERFSPVASWAHDEAVRALCPAGSDLTPASPTALPVSAQHHHADRQPQSHYPPEHVQQCVQFGEEFLLASEPAVGGFRMLTPQIGRALACDFGGVQIRMTLAIPTRETIVGMHDLC